MTTKIFYSLSLLLGLALLFIGGRFLFSPEMAEKGFGLQIENDGDHAFHYIKGVRDIFSGLLFLLFTISGQKRALAFTSLAGAIIPLTDCLIVLSKPYNTPLQTIPHVIAFIFCILVGTYFFKRKEAKVEEALPKGYAKLIESANGSSKSVLELTITPGEQTPWHYHTKFSETFSVLSGQLSVGKNGNTQILMKGDELTIAVNEKHYFNNISNEDCVIQVSINPGNTDFEDSILILKGLSKDGFTSRGGAPKNLSDLAVFIYLNNSRMTGPQRLAQPIFTHIAKSAIKKGKVHDLRSKYL